MYIVALIAAFICNGVANVLLKLASSRGFSFGALLHGQWAVSQLYALVAVGFFGLNLCFYLYALEKIPLSVGYPVMVSMTFIVIVLGSIFVFRESITPLQYLGYALIVAGVILAVGR